MIPVNIKFKKSINVIAIKVAQVSLLGHTEYVKWPNSRLNNNLWYISSNKISVMVNEVQKN